MTSHATALLSHERSSQTYSCVYIPLILLTPSSTTKYSRVSDPPNCYVSICFGFVWNVPFVIMMYIFGKNWTNQLLKQVYFTSNHLSLVGLARIQSPSSLTSCCFMGFTDWIGLSVYVGVLSHPIPALTGIRTCWLWLHWAEQECVSERVSAFEAIRPRNLCWDDKL